MSSPPLHLTVAIAEPSQVGEARRTAAALGERIGLDETDRGRVSLVATELATNLCRHARDGKLLLRPLGSARAPGIELLAIDRGPGMQDVRRCMVDGYSTSSSPGTGLGAVRRAADAFDVHSTQPAGTVLVARVLARNGQAQQPRGARVDWAAVCIPVQGEDACGDTWSVRSTPAEAAFLVADGLGHGLLAAEAAQRAAETFAAAPALDPCALLERAHERLRGSRGAAVAIGVVDCQTGALRYSAMGNISVRLLSAKSSRTLVSLNGTVGVQTIKPKEFRDTWRADEVLIAHSDGLATRWDLGDSGLATRDPAVIAGTLYRDHARGRDDVTVLVGRRHADGANP